LAFNEIEIMKSSKPTVAIPVDVKDIAGRPFHAVGEKYINAVAFGANAFPVLLPALSQGEQIKALNEYFDIEELIQQYDGIFLPGSLSNVNPERYGQSQKTPDLPTDFQRDESTYQLIHAALKYDIPLLGVCRGFQEMNVAFGGTLHQKVHDQAEFMDHREDQSKSYDIQYDLAHDIHLTPNGILASLTDSETVRINSLHGQGVDKLGDNLVIEATAPDGLIEAFRVDDETKFALAVQWHPEWKVEEYPFYNAIFQAFGEAIRKRHKQRMS